MIRSLQDCIARYGEIANGSWPGASTWCSLLQVPPELSKTWINSISGVGANHIYCNKDMAPALARVFQRLIASNLQPEMKTFDGCWMVRDVRGIPGQISAHSYALAIDINAKTNALGVVGDMPSAIVACFKAEWFAWGGDFKRLDMMHFSYCWE